MRLYNFYGVISLRESVARPGNFARRSAAARGRIHEQRRRHSSSHAVHSFSELFLEIGNHRGEVCHIRRETANLQSLSSSDSAGNLRAPAPWPLPHFSRIGPTQTR